MFQSRFTDLSSLLILEEIFIFLYFLLFSFVFSKTLFMFGMGSPTFCSCSFRKVLDTVVGPAVGQRSETYKARCGLPKKIGKIEDGCEQGHSFVFEIWKVLVCHYHNEAKEISAISLAGTRPLSPRRTPNYRKVKELAPDQRASCRARI